jgi:hypothetical protein
MREASESPYPPDAIQNGTSTDEAFARKMQDEWNKETKLDAVPAPISSENRAPSGGSFSSLNSTSSKRVFRHGQEVVGNSDSDTDSSEGLEDLDDLLRSKPSSMKPKGTTDSPKEHNKYLPTRSSRHSAYLRPQKPLIPPAKKYKVSLSSLVEESKRDAARQAKFEAAKAKLAEPVPEPTTSESVEKTLASLVEDDEEGGEAERLMLAMKRTNVFQRDPTWQFFRADIEGQSRRAFPKSSLARQKWASVFKGLMCNLTSSITI